MTHSQGKGAGRGKTKHGAPPAAPGAAQEAATVPLKILVVDDDAVDRMNVCGALRKSKLNVEIEEVESLAAAYERLRAGPYNVVVLDHLLPDGKSVDFLRELRSHGLRVPVVVTTGYGDEALVVELLKTGAGDYVPKDRITSDSIFRAVSHAIRVFREHEEGIRKDALLEASAQAAALLHARSERLTVLGDALSLLGRALDADRLAVFELTSQAHAQAPIVAHRCEWIATADESRSNDPAQQQVPFERLGLARWHAALLSGRVVAGMPASMAEDERALLAARGVRSLLAAPIMVGGRCWGFVLIEAHRKERIWSEQEKHVLLTLSAAIGGTLLHRRDDDALRHSDALHREIVNLQTEMIARFTPDCRLTFVNEAYCRHCSRSQAELLGADFRAFIPKPQHAALAAHLAGLKPNQPVGTHENDVQSADGTVRWIQWTHRAFFDEHGRIREYQSVGRDITALQDAQNALREREEQHRMLLENLTVGVFRTTPDGRILQANTAHARMLGFERPDELMSLRITDFYQRPEQRAQLLEELSKKGSVRGYILHMKKKDGTPIVISLSSKAHDAAPGKIAWMDGVVEDVTERSRAEADRRRATESLQTALTQLEELEAIINRSPAVVVVWRAVDEWPLEFVSRNVQRLLEYTPDDFLSGRVSWVGITHPDDVPWLEEEIAQRVREGTDEFVQKYRLITKSGRTRWVEDHTLAIRNPEGGITHLQGILLDITERHEAEVALQESESRFREFAELMPQTVFEVDMDGRLTFVNKSAMESWGYTAEDIASLRCFDIVEPGQRERMREGMRQRSEGDKTAHEYTAVRKDGTTFPILLYAVPITGDGQPAGIRGIAIDITERKQIEEERKRYASTLLEVQERERRDISATLHDHLGQLLTLTQLELGSVRGADEQSSESLRKALQRLGDALRSVRRLAVSLRPPILDDLGIESAIEALVEEFVDSSGIDVCFTRKGGALRLGEKQETCLYRLAQEALTNAVRHAHATRVELTLNADDAGATLEAKDNGKGFESAQSEPAGGIGFILMRERLADCGGTLTLSSPDAGGTILQARLCMEKAPEG